MTLLPLLLLLQAPAIAVAPAYAEPGGLTFEAPDSVDWEALVPAPLREAALRADPGRLARLYAERTDYGGPELRFTAPLPSALARRHYLLADSAGIHPIRPDSLLGTVRLAWADSGPILHSILVFGAVRAPAPGAARHGFVLSAPMAFAIDTAPSQRTADQLLGPGGADYPYRGTPFWDIVRQYRLRLLGTDGQGWIWVQWAPDTENREAACEQRLSLFAVGDEPRQLASVSTGCDL